MTLDEIKQIAFDWNAPVDCSEPMPERVLWFSLKEIYKNYRDSIITRSDGERLVQDALRQYRIDSTVLAMQRLQIQHQADMWKAIERSGSEYRLNRTVENADAFINAVYGFEPTRRE